jgi:hypothetical protein
MPVNAIKESLNTGNVASIPANRFFIQNNQAGINNKLSLCFITLMVEFTDI